MKSQMGCQAAAARTKLAPRSLVTRLSSPSVPGAGRGAFANNFCGEVTSLGDQRSEETRRNTKKHKENQENQENQQNKASYG